MSNTKAIDGSKANKAATNIASSLSNEPTVSELVWHISVIQETLCESIDEDVDGIIASSVAGNGRSLTQLTGGCSYGTKSLKEVGLSGMYESNLSRKQVKSHYIFAQVDPKYTQYDKEH
ncbi:unnamed protein product [Mucor circinelloides]